MKDILLKYSFFFALIFTTFFACSEEDNLMPEGEWDLSNPTIVSPEDNSSINLEELNQNDVISFSWEPAESSAGYGVTYRVAIDTIGTTDFSMPIISKASSDGGATTSVSFTYSELDLALSYAGYSANSDAELTFAVIATSLSNTSQDIGNFTLHRFETEYIPSILYLSGSATENGENLSSAIQLKRLNNAEGAASNIHEVYTHLESGATFKFYSNNALPAFQYGGSDGILVKSGNGISVEESGEYRIKVDLDNSTYELWKVDYWSIVGSPIEGEWGGDIPLTYQGGGIWAADIDFQRSGGFVFRANGDWAYLLKRIVGTPNALIMESDAASQGLTFEDIPNEITGNVHVMLNLSAQGYSYSVELNDTGSETVEQPESLFLFENGTMIQELMLDGLHFRSEFHIPMQASASYTLNSANDGSGTSVSINGLLAETDNPDGDSVSGFVPMTSSDATFTVSNDRALKLDLNFETGRFNWQYYNVKLFHWSNWDERDEILMTYSHPNTFTLTADLTAGYEMKFISPWDLDMGSDTPTATSGTVIAGGGQNLTCITTNGSYDVTLTMAEDYQTATYSFE